ncbi:MAG TPA: hypothetical protein VF395_23050 [Polyangiaceae bacterium]
MSAGKALDPLNARDARIAVFLLLLTGVVFVSYHVVLLPRLTNVDFGDVEFTGWSGPMGSRLVHGDRPYLDFVLPVPPGSFLVLSLLERIAGRPLLLQELGLNATIHLVMGFLAYVMGRAVTSRRNAVLTAVATLVTVTQLNKECAYDHTAQLVAWGSITAGLWALVTPDAAKQRVLFILTGALAGFTLAFKQSTAIGCIGGWVVGIAYLAFVEYRAGNLDRARSYERPLAAYAHGLGLGFAGVWLMLLLLGSTWRAFFQAVFLDGSTLKGGARFLVRNLVIYLFDYAVYPASLVLIAAFVMVGARLLTKRGSLHIGDEFGREGRYEVWEAVAMSVIVTAGAGAGAYFLMFGPPGYPFEWITVIDRAKHLPSLSLVPACVVFVAHLAKPSSRDRSPDVRTDPWRAGHVLNATLLAALCTTVMHNTSAPEFRPYYDNNVLIPLTLLSAFIVLDRAELRPVSVLVVALIIGGAGGNKYFRAMTATTKMGNTGHWAGLRVSGHGAEMARIAARVQALTKPEDTVLVLPEDLEIAALIGRPRPPLIGAILFVDQYAPRLATDDIARLDENPPKVIVIHPREARSWQRFFRIWSGQSGAERVMLHVLNDLLPARYVLDSTYSTTFLWEAENLDIYVRRDRP